MELHPAQGAEKLLQLKEFGRLPLRAIHVALEHHIKEDDTGYPHTFKKQTTNLFSKIVKVVDYFDAITTKRVYRKNVFTRAEALSLMMEQIGTEFNPVILKAFVNMMGAYPIGTRGPSGYRRDRDRLQHQSRPPLRPPAAGQAHHRPGGEPHRRRDGRPLGKGPGDRRGSPGASVRPLDPDKYGINVPDYFLAPGVRSQLFDIARPC